MPKVHIVESQVYFSSYGDNHERNTQPIKEALMREAVKQCDCYCTDLLVFFDHSYKELLEGELTEVALYFRRMGIDWKEEVKDYRSKATLKRNIKEDTLELTIESGNY